MDRVSQLRAALPDDFTIISGDDALTLPFLAAGATGVISVTSNVIPAEVSQMVRAFADGNATGRAGCTTGFIRCTRSFSSSRTRCRPRPRSSLMKDWMTPDVRLPLCEMGEANFQQLRRVLANVELIKA